MSDRDANQPTAAKINLHSLDAILNAFVVAAQDSEQNRGSLYRDFHTRITEATCSLASAVFAKLGDSQFNLVSQAGWQQLDSAAIASVKSAIKRRYRKSRNPPGPSPQEIDTFVGKTSSLDNGVEFFYVLVRPTESEPAVAQVLGDLVQEIANQIETYEIRRTVREKPKAIRDLTHLAQLVQNVGKSKSMVQLAMHLVNDIAKSTQCDRVCFFNPSGKLLAVSGVTQASLKTALARNLTRIARLVKSSGQAIELVDHQFTFDNSRRHRKAVRLVEQLDSEAIYVAPLKSGKRCCGIVSFEYFQDGLSDDWASQRNLIDESMAFVAPIVDRATSINSIPGIGLLDWLFNRLLVRPVRLLMWMCVFAALGVAAYYFLMLVPRPMEIRAEGTLQPIEKRNVFSPRDGEIKSLLVTEGSFVDSGKQLLSIESKTLEDQRIVIEGELAEVNQQLQTLSLADFGNNSLQDDDATDRRTQAASEIERYKGKVLTLEKRLVLLQQQDAELQVLAPIAGQVTTPNIEHRLNARPLDRGDLLMTISDTAGQWQIEMLVPDNRIEFIKSSKDPRVRFRLAADSETVYEGKIREFDYRVTPAETDSETYVRVEVDVDESDLSGKLLQGSRVIAKIDCGEKNNLYLLTYEIRNKIREWFFF
jgi:multidrug efflux pump subunit AcrA (membrane-fusion protein)